MTYITHSQRQKKQTFVNNFIAQHPRLKDFGNFYLDEIGFSPVGVPLAWAIKLSHVLCALCLLFNKFTKPAAILTILILIAGIILVHFKEGWFVVGAGRNGIEFNFLLIVVLITILLPKGLKKIQQHNFYFQANTIFSDRY
ncbi:MAG: DoxX family membrane protein [Chitinophagaceae bacterium]|nr:DoxX family membrane protein [Chitinophagaceae bacterium]